MEISYLQHENIDKQKWDRCIDSAGNGLIYAYACYLDSMSKSWDALVMNDYEAVMPLTWKKKIGISYLSQPAFTQQSGIFGNLDFDNGITEKFINKALELYPFLEITLNYANVCKRPAATRCNLVLSLNQPFASIEKSFKKDLIKNVKKAEKSDLVYEATEEIAQAISLHKKTYSNRLYFTNKNYENFLDLCVLLKYKSRILVRKVSSPAGKLLAIGVFLKDDKRIYKAMTTTLPDGRRMEANHYLLYKLIKEYSGQNLLFDFAGSEIPSINFFCRKFGPVEQPYSFVRFNKLPFWKKAVKTLYDKYKNANNKILLF